MRLKHIALAIPLLLLAADSPSVPVNPTATLSWDAPTVNADGTPCTDLAGYVVAISAPTVDLAAGGTPLQQAQITGAALTTQALAPLVSGRAAGLYRVWVRAFDAAGNLSVWAAPLLVDVDPVAPNAPGGFKVKVTVIVEVGG